MSGLTRKDRDTIGVFPLKGKLMNVDEISAAKLNNNDEINNIKKRLTKEAQEKLFEDDNIENIPATTEGLLNLYFSQEYYKNRVQREDEEESNG